MNELMEIDFVLEGKTCWIIKGYTAPKVGEIVQILGKDYTVKQRFWAVDYADTHARTLRAIIGLEETG